MAEVDNSQYMYLKMDPSDRYPVQEIRVDDMTLTHEKMIKGKPHREPNFLSPSYPKPRIVEFYAHWCPHCIHFKPQYIQFARKMKQIGADIGHQVEVFAVSCVPFDIICRDHDVNGYPTVQLFNANAKNGTVIQRNQLHPLMVFRRFGINVQPDSVKEEEHPLIAHDHAVAASHKTAHFLHKSQQEAYNDAHLSLDFALRNGVFVTNNPLSTEVKTALKDFLTVVQKTFPTNAPLHPLMDHLIDNFNDIFGAEESDMEKALNQFTGPPSSKWSPACTQHGTGYTCGLWQLFHIITIGAIEWNEMSPDKTYQLTTMHVADCIRGFVEHFFQCEECRMHFLHEYDSCSYGRCNRLTSDHKDGDNVAKWKELPLWLYETHNGVNARLRKERLERQENELNNPDDEQEDTTPQEVLWPPKEWCSSCWLGDGRWEDHAVYEFLRAQYWPGVTFDDSKNHLPLGLMELEVLPNVQAEEEEEPVRERQRKRRRRRRDNDSEVREPLPLWKQMVASAAIIMIFVMASIAWYRKIQFDRKGYLKKNESFDPKYNV